MLLPLIPHFGLGPRAPVMLHPIEPSLTLMRAGSGADSRGDLAFGLAGSIGWSAVAFLWGRNRVARLMQDTRATRGRLNAVALRTLAHKASDRIDAATV